MSDTKCQCNHHKVSHATGRCLGRYGGLHDAGQRCDCTEYKPMTESEQRAVQAIEEMMQ